MNIFKPLTELDLDPSTSLRLAVDAGDPPRFFLLDYRERAELIAIADADLARERFQRRVAEQGLQRNLREHA